MSDPGESIRLAGSFYLFRQLQKHAVFLRASEPPTAFGVLGLTETIDVVTGRRLPILAEAVLLPFQGRIVYDGILLSHNIYFGGGIKRMLNETYQKAKNRLGFVTSLPFEEADLKQRQEKKAEVRGSRSLGSRRVRGRWKITSMTAWDADFIDLQGEGFLEFGPQNTGELRFGCISAGLDYRVGQLGGNLDVEFTFEGFDEGTACSGRGRAIVEGDRLTGRIFLHQGDESGFVATKLRGR